LKEHFTEFRLSFDLYFSSPPKKFFSNEATNSIWWTIIKNTQTFFERNACGVSQNPASPSLSEKISRRTLTIKTIS